MPSLTSDQILKILSGDPRTAIGQGPARYQRHALGTLLGDTRTREFLDGILETPRLHRTVTSVPWAGAMIRPSQQDQPFTAADIEWLRRVPRKPEEISDADARELYLLAQQAKPGTPDARLIRSIFNPVREIHERIVAEAALAEAKTPLWEMPTDEAHGLLVDALLRETDLSENEAKVRARDRIVAVQDRIHQEREQRIQQAEAQYKSITEPTELGHDPSAAQFGADAA